MLRRKQVQEARAARERLKRASKMAAALSAVPSDALRPGVKWLAAQELKDLESDGFQAELSLLRKDHLRISLPQGWPPGFAPPVPSVQKTPLQEDVADEEKENSVKEVSAEVIAKESDAIEKEDIGDVENEKGITSSDHSDRSGLDRVGSGRNRSERSGPTKMNKKKSSSGLKRG